MEGVLKVILDESKLHSEALFAFLEMPLYEKLMKRKAQARKGSYLFKNIESLSIKICDPIEVKLVEGIPREFFVLRVELEQDPTTSLSKFNLFKTYEDINDLHESLLLKVKG